MEVVLSGFETADGVRTTRRDVGPWDHSRASTRSPEPRETPHLSVPADEHWFPQPDGQLNLTLTLVTSVAWELSRKHGKPAVGGGPGAPGAVPAAHLRKEAAQAEDLRDRSPSFPTPLIGPWMALFLDSFVLVEAGSGMSKWWLGKRRQLGVT